jgi:hypothetical protein
MKCHNCGGTQFRRSVTIKTDLEAVYEGNGVDPGDEPRFCDFIGDLNDQVFDADVIETEATFTCNECNQEYEPGEICDECGAEIPDDADSVINAYHELSCSCHPDNTATATTQSQTVSIPILGCTVNIVLSQPGPEGNRSGRLESNLREKFGVPAGEDGKLGAIVDALESFILAQAAEGIDVTTSAYGRALKTAIEALSNEHCD